MITKKQVINSINSLPDSVSVDDIIDNIILLAKIDIGLEQSANGQVLTEEELDKKLSKWEECSGLNKQRMIWIILLNLLQKIPLNKPACR